MSDHMKVMVGEGWMLTLERSDGYESIEPGRMVEAIQACSHVLNGSADTPAAPQQELEELVEEFNGWWHLHRGGSVNAAYQRIDAFTKQAREILETAPAAPERASYPEKRSDADWDARRLVRLAHTVEQHQRAGIEESDVDFLMRMLKAERAERTSLPALDA
jgi:hypothetical protein